MRWKNHLPENSIKDLPVIAEVDILVAGGGAAGVAAAETAARKGNKVLLVEKYGFLGGAAVAGLSGTICGLFLTDENDQNAPEQIVYGFADKFYQNMMQAGGVTKPQRYGKTWTVTHEPFIWKETAEKMLLDAGVELMYHTYIVDVLIEEDVIKGVVIFSKSGFGIIRSKVTIDASGDGQIVFSAGYDYTLGDNGRIQNPTMIFRLAGVDIEKYMDYWGLDTISPPKVVEKLICLNEKDPVRYPRTKIWVFDTPRRNELLINATRLVDANGMEYNPLDPVQSTQAEIMAKKQIHAYADFFKENVPGCEESFINDTAPEIGTRQTRTIVGIETLTNHDVVTKRKRKNGMVKSSWPIELHSGTKPKTEWLTLDYYEVPFETLVPVKGENIIVAGRCLSSEHEALASSRVTAQCFEYGHAAGLASDHVIKSKTPFRNIQGEEVRLWLNKDGARLG